ncbi:MAG: gamma-glutamyl-gamma-aminobutyrate hydrolase family protein [Phycisphaera sp.]|nr:gamma-glutamyl-gamma-aminobutyrate hydrolase family protein [Phycisphaera sp.]
MNPVIGITVDTSARSAAEVRGRCTPDARLWYESPFEYARAVSEAGGVPVMLPYEVERIGDYLVLCDGILLSGGDDPDTAAFGEAVHPAAKVLHPARQAFELALLAALAESRHAVLGVCLGMQWMALAAGGRLHQHLAEAPGFDAALAALHKDNDHAVALVEGVGEHPHLPASGVVHSHHHQAVADPGALRTVATAPDGVIEVIDRPGARFYVGVQWHPERTVAEPLGIGLIRAFVAASR